MVLAVDTDVSSALGSFTLAVQFNVPPVGDVPSIKFPAMGLIVAIYGTTLIVSMAGDTFKIKEVLILATILSVMSYLAFILLLKLQFPVWPTFISG